MVASSRACVVLHVLVGFTNASAASASSRFPRASISFNKSIRLRSHVTDNTRLVDHGLVTPRGGESTDVYEKEFLKSTFAPDTLVKVLSAVTVATCLPCAVDAEKGGQLFGLEVPPGTLSSYFLELAGVVGTGSAITAVLTTAGSTSLSRAIGFGLLPRVVWGLRKILDGTFTKLEAKKTFLRCVPFVAFPCLFSLLSGRGNPIAAAKVIAVATGIGGLSMVARPQQTAEFLLGFDLDAEEGKTQESALARTFGREMLISAVHIGSLALGTDPITAVGHACVVSAVGLAREVACGKWDDLGGTRARNSQLVFLLLTASLSARFLTA